MDWQGMPVLVTGAGGFIGSHLVEELVERGADVRAFVRYNSRQDIGLLQLVPQEKRRRVEVIAGDLRDVEAVAQATQGVGVVFHLGALISIPYSYLHPREVVETNVLGTLNILMAARACQVDKIIHTSSSEVYGTARSVPMAEDHPLQGQSPYSASKISADKIAESFYRSYALPVATIRPFNTYGPRQSARAVIPTIITQALTMDRVLLGELSPRRDFTYVSDVVAAFLQAAESQACVGQVINIGSGEDISIGDLARKIIALVGREVEIVADKRRCRPPDSEVWCLRADNRKALELLGWSPQVLLDEGLSMTIEWIARNLECYRPGEYQI
jgi:dTDP-glucose 4,6-dehydratase